MNHWLFRVKVTGESMWPVLVPGKTYWASNLIKPTVGRIVVFRDPKKATQYVVKKIVNFENNRVYLAGTVSWSESYIVSRSDIVGVLIRF